MIRGVPLQKRERLQISDRLFRVAALGVVPADDPHVIADANALIEELTAEVDRLRPNGEQGRAPKIDTQEEK